MARCATRLLNGLRQYGHYSRALAILFVVTTIFLLTSHVSHAAQSDLEFKIVRNGDVIGYHRITFRQDGGQLIVYSDLKIEVKTLSFIVYRYEQTRSEVWRNSKLVALDSVANDDGTLYEIEGRAGPNGMRVTSHGTNWTLPADSIPASYWNVSMVTAKGRPLVDGQSGKILDASVTKIGQERVTVGGKDIVAMHYRLGVEQPRDLWYDTRGQWVKMRVTGRDGSVAEWVLK